MNGLKELLFRWNQKLVLYRREEMNTDIFGQIVTGCDKCRGEDSPEEKYGPEQFIMFLLCPTWLYHSFQRHMEPVCEHF